jgi:CPA2 family monovalent cation:H+ antiporter-2
VHLPPLIIDLAVILGVAGIMTFIFQKIRQPVVLGYILAGVIVGPHTPPVQLIVDVPSIQTWAELGVIFLMFTLGLEFSFRKLMSVGLTAGLAAGLEVAFFLVAGYGAGRWFGWSSMDSLFLGAMLSISSTTIIIKALEELKLKSHRFSSLIFGILIVEDLFAILLLVGLTTIASTQSFSIVALFSAGLNLLLVIGSWFITGYFIVPRMMTYVGRTGNNEMVTLVSIGLCLALVVLASHFGYSPALGAFIMGSILAETKIIHRIEGLMAPLKDLFGAIFFVSIGMLIDPQIIWEYKETIALLCLLTIFGKIVSTSLGALISGQSFKNSLQVGFGLAQIGEFSFIIASLGMALDAISPRLYPIAVAVSIVTTFTTPYLIKYSGRMADRIEGMLPLEVKNSLNRYVIWCEHKKTGNSFNKELIVLFARWIANGIVVTLIFNLSLKFIGPTITQRLGLFSIWTKFITWSLAFIMSSPFIWGMVFTSRKNYIGIRKEMNISKIVVVLLLPILTSIWIGVLSTKYFSLRYIIPITGIFLVIIYFTMYKRLESYYRWFERTFLETFENPENSDSSSENYAKLAPWDSHLISIVVHPNANMVNQSLMNSKLRSRYGINVVAIQRGMQSLIAPNPSEIIFPGDTLVVLGTDEQLDKVRPELEVPENIATMFDSNADYRLKHFKLSPSSEFVNHSIREAGVREKYHVMIVGVERDSSRIVNPHTDFKLLANDTLWVVGEAKMLEDLVASLD